MCTRDRDNVTTWRQYWMQADNLHDACYKYFAVTSLAVRATHSLWTRWFRRSCPTLWCQSLVGFPTASAEDIDCDPVSEVAGSPLHRETTVDETALTVDTADVDDGSMPSVLYIFSSDRASFCTVVAVVDAADGGDEVTAAVTAVDVTRRSDAFFSGEHTGQSERTQFFQCQMICRRRAQCCTGDNNIQTQVTSIHFNNSHNDNHFNRYFPHLLGSAQGLLIKPTDAEQYFFGFQHFDAWATNRKI